MLYMDPRASTMHAMSEAGKRQKSRQESRKNKISFYFLISDFKMGGSTYSQDTIQTEKQAAQRNKIKQFIHLEID